MRSIITLLLLLPACGSLSREEAGRLAEYQERAAFFWEGARGGDPPLVRKKLDQCLDQAERGLAIDSDDYKLLSIKGMVLLRLSKLSTGPARARTLGEAEALFERLYATRSPVQHLHQVLLGYAMTLQAQGMSNLEQARQLNDAASRSGAASSDALAKKAKATEHDSIGRSKLLMAREVLAALEQRGDLPRVCYFHQMQVAAALGEKDATVALGDKYLKASHKEQDSLRADIARTPSLQFERERGASLKDLQTDEIDVRSMLAELHYDRRQFDKALEHLQVILHMDPGRTADYYNRGRCLRELGQLEEAKADFRKFLATSDLPAGNPKMTEAVRALESQ